MRRIIQKYQEGGVVQSAPGPAVATGIPQGGHAAAAIQSYLSGQAAGPLSYTAGQSTVPDYRALANERRRLRGEIAATGASAEVQRQAIKDADSIALSSTKSTSEHWGNADPGATVNIAANITEDNPTGKTYVDPAAAGEYEANFIRNESVSDEDFWNDFESGSASGNLISGGGYDGAGQYGVLGDIGGGVRNLANASIVNTGYKALTGNDLISKYVQPESITNYSNNEAIAGISNTGSPINATSNINTNHDDNGPTHEEIMADHQARRAAETKAIQSDMSDDDFWDAWEGNNNGGPIGPRVKTYNNGSPGGVEVAKSGLREDEIRQRQLMQARMPQTEASPLSDIGSKLAMGAVDKGIESAASSMAAKEGFVGTLGTALGGNAVTGAATGAAGTGLMAALGPIGIGIGLGKLFGLFNDGGKVPCSCGKTSCKCAKEMKSPLSGE